MTIVEALTVAIQVPGIDAATLEKACIDADLEGADTYGKSSEQVVDLAAVSVLNSLILQSESEGGFSYSISPEALQRRITFLLNKWGVSDANVSAQPKVRGVNVW